MQHAPGAFPSVLRSSRRLGLPCVLLVMILTCCKELLISQIAVTVSIVTSGLPIPWCPRC